MTDKTFYLRPATGRLVRDPLTREPLPAEGAAKPRTTYWLRRVREGDALVSAPPRSTASETTSTKKGDRR